jgi:RNA polymerase sigma factor (sigma-70 family)
MNASSRPLFSLRHWIATHVPRAVPGPDAIPGDADLLGRYRDGRDSEAFAALIDRHGPMVLGVARRITGNDHTADDVFQATFVALAQRAGAIHRPTALPAWLHHTARHFALAALRSQARRTRAESAAGARGACATTFGDPLAELTARELVAVLDEELGLLPESLRLPLILCCLEGRSQDEAAALLGWSPGSVKGRLERGRKRLRERLAYRGLTFSVGVGMPLLLAHSPVLAGSLRQATVAALAGVRRPVMFALGWKIVTAITLLAAGLGVTWLAMMPADKPGVAAEKPADRLDVPAAPDALPAGAIRRLGWSPLRIGNSAFALSPDAKEIVTVSPEGIARRFNAVTGRLLERRTLLDRAGVNPVGQPRAQLSDDGQVAAIVDGPAAGTRVSVIEVATGKLLFRRTSGKIGLGVSRLSPDGKRLAIAEYPAGWRGNPTLRVHDVRSGKNTDLGMLGFNVYYLRFSADGERVAASEISSDTGEPSLSFFDVSAGKRLWRRKHRGSVYALSPDGTTIVSAVYQDGPGFQVIETKRTSGEPVERFVEYSRAHPNVSLRFAPDNHTLVIRDFEGLVLFDLAKGTDRKRIALPQNSGGGYGPELGAFSGDGKTVVTNLGSLQRWDLVLGKPMFPQQALTGLRGSVSRVAFAADGKKLYAASWGLQLGCWDTADGNPIGAVKSFVQAHLVRTRKGPRVLEVDREQKGSLIHVGDPASARPPATIRWADLKEMKPNTLRACGLTTDAASLLVAHADEPGGKNSYVTVCDVTTGRRVSRITIPGLYPVYWSPFSPCGRWVVFGDKMFHIATGQVLFSPRTPGGERLYEPAPWRDRAPVWFSDDGRLFAGRLATRAGKGQGRTDTLAVWEMASGNVLARFPGAGAIGEVVFSPDGRRIALLDGLGVGVHDLMTGKPVATFNAPDIACEPTDRVSATSQPLAFAPDGKTLATGHRDGSITVWRVPPAMGSPRIAADERERIWADLASPNAVTSRAAVERLVHDPAEAIHLLQARFAPPAPGQGTAKLIEQLDAEAFTDRQSASRKLVELGWRAEMPLRRAARTAASLEVRRRAETILQQISPIEVRRPLTGAALRGVRAIEVLERIGGEPARKLLEGWAEQTGDAELAAEARGAVGHP